MIVKSTFVQKLLYWLFNIISPSINAQVIITYILAQKSKFCQLAIQAFSGGNPDESLLKPMGNDTIAWNWVILVLHIILLLQF